MSPSLDRPKKYFLEKLGNFSNINIEAKIAHGSIARIKTYIYSLQIDIQRRFPKFSKNVITTFNSQITMFIYPHLYISPSVSIFSLLRSKIYIYPHTCIHIFQNFRACGANLYISPSIIYIPIPFRFFLFKNGSIYIPIYIYPHSPLYFKCFW